MSGTRWKTNRGAPTDLLCRGTLESSRNTHMRRTNPRRHTRFLDILQTLRTLHHTQTHDIPTCVIYQNCYFSINYTTLFKCLICNSAQQLGRRLVAFEICYESFIRHERSWLKTVGSVRELHRTTCPKVSYGRFVLNALTISNMVK